MCEINGCCDGPTEDRNRAYSPHCDSSILHAPGKCEYCDEYPDWQRYREVARIAFTNEMSDNKAPCPSVWHRSPEMRDLWYGNVARSE